ncbi:MAG: 4-hydroxy-tetrahydrodipicolinate synthase [Patescibacteria group bacterium]
MTKRKYAGTWTALITPFKKDGELDEDALRKLVRRQAANGITGVVPVGTTGESPTTTAQEDENIFKIVVDEARKIADGGGGHASRQAGKIMVMAGTGSNCTEEAVEYTETAKRAGVDCCLVVTPYYNKPTPKGLKLHFKAVADVGLPVIVYNIKGRTGINIDTDTLMEIAAHPMVVGVKEASGDLAQMRDVIARRAGLEKEFTVLSGDDGLTLELIKMGGDGVVSVASNLMPKEVSGMVDLALNGKFEEAAAANEGLTRLFKDIFVETNPIPVKYIASRMGLCELSYRLPMCEPSEKAAAALEETIKFYRLQFTHVSE